MKYSNKRLFSFAATLALLLASSANVLAASASYSFYKVTNNNVEDLGDQLSLTMWDATEANSEFGLSLGSSQILFTIQNAVGIESSVSEVWIDDGLLGPSTVINSLGGFTAFEGGDVAPPNMPGANLVDPVFEATTGLSADVDPGPPSNGVDQSIDILGIVLGLGSFADFDEVAAAIQSGDIRFGIHARGIGVAGFSDTYVNLPAVPVPAAAWLFGSALFGLGFLKRKNA